MAETKKLEEIVNDPYFDQSMLGPPAPGGTILYNDHREVAANQYDNGTDPRHSDLGGR